MIKLFSLKQQKKEGETSKTTGTKRASAAQLRITKGQCITSSEYELVNFMLPSWAKLVYYLSCYHYKYDTFVEFA